MKFSFLSKTVVLALIASLSVSVISAQSAPTPAKKSSATQKPKTAPQANEDSDLNLTADQQAKFKQIDDEYKAKKKAAREAGNNAEMKKIQQERVAARKAVLNAEQAKKYDERIAKNEAKRQEQMQKHQDKAAQKGEKGKHHGDDHPKGKPGKSSDKAGKGKGHGHSDSEEGKEDDDDDDQDKAAKSKKMEKKPKKGSVKVAPKSEVPANGGK